MEGPARPRARGAGNHNGDRADRAQHKNGGGVSAPSGDELGLGSTPPNSALLHEPILLGRAMGVNNLEGWRAMRSMVAALD